VIPTVTPLVISIYSTPPSRTKKGSMELKGKREEKKMTNQFMRRKAYEP